MERKPPTGNSVQGFDSLRRAREERGLSLAEAAAGTGIRASLLESLEHGELGTRLGAGYVRNMACRYAVYLGLKPDDFLRMGEGNLGQGRDEDAPRAEFEEFFRTGRRRDPDTYRRVRRVVVGLAVLLMIIAVGLVELQLGPGRSALSLVLDSEGPGTAPADTGVGESMGPSSTAQEATGPASTGSTTAEAAEVSEANGRFPSPSPAPRSRPSETPTMQAETRPGTGGTTLPEGSASEFELMVVPRGEVWFELKYEDGQVLFAGLREEGDELMLYADNPVLAVIGKPRSVEVYIDGQSAFTPDASLWRITAEGVSARESR